MCVSYYLLAEQGLAVRKATIAKYNLLNKLGTTNVSKDRPLQVGRDAVHNIGDMQGGSGYGFILFEGKIMLMRGMLQYYSGDKLLNMIKHFSAFYLHKVRR
jgi:hypothetical protein